MSFDDIIAMEITLKPGDTVVACTPFMCNEPRKIHIRHVLDSIYEGRKLYVYAIYGKTKQWWHEFMCDDHDLKFMIARAKNYKK
jgi:hypothetical protein